MLLLEHLLKLRLHCRNNRIVVQVRALVRVCTQVKQPGPRLLRQGSELLRLLARLIDLFCGQRRKRGLGV